MQTTIETGSPQVPHVTPFDLGEGAVRRIAHLLRFEPAGSHLRIGVIGGGCSGFQYTYDFETTALDPDDLLIERDGARVAVDSTSLTFLNNALLDYVETLGASAFEITNPNTKASCGCGNSFSVL